jgi:hypothetical protein
MTDFQAIADRVEIEALRGEFTDAAMMRDYDRAASLFTEDGVHRSRARRLPQPSPFRTLASDPPQTEGDRHYEV